MKLEFVEIQNFRKLKSCRIDFSDSETLFVGANNSGKTSAMDALILFLKDRKQFTTKDFTLSNWQGINNIGKDWIEQDDENPDTSKEAWINYLPQMDIWLNVGSNEIHYVNHLIPTLQWKEGILGVRLILEPKNIDDLYARFIADYKTARKSYIPTDTSKKALKLWPISLWDYLDKKFQSNFTVRAFILNPSKVKSPIDGYAQPQKLSTDIDPIEGDPFEGLIKVDIINAQRGFTDPNADNLGNSHKIIGNLSYQLRQYYKKHLNPLDYPDDSDIDALVAIDEAQTAFDNRLKESFKSSIGELETLNYPGFGNPNITISSKVNPIDGLNHSSSVLFDVLNDPLSDEDPIHLPEKYNGLGYQNLISMVFKLISFRDDWMQVGKVGQISNSNVHMKGFEPLHLVLIEEPEAHLHAQVQQVFIRKAYQVLRENKLLVNNDMFQTQLVVSTHSNHIAHEVDFIKLRYFKRQPVQKKGEVPISTIVNLSETFGGTDETTKFAIRYLKTTHCDLFFADAVILVEGPVERILVPHFIREKFTELSSRYISLLEIGGSHAHTLKPLIENLGIITLIVTDIDSIDPKENRKAKIPMLKKGYKTGNDTLKTWIPRKDDLDTLLKLKDEDKCSVNKLIRVAYQTAIELTSEEIVLPYTFEDSLAFSNKSFFEKQKGIGLMKKIIIAMKEKDLITARENIFQALKGGGKAKFALDLLYMGELKELKVPNYIEEGLLWLDNKLKNQKDTL